MFQLIYPPIPVLDIYLKIDGTCGPVPHLSSSHWVVQFQLWKRTWNPSSSFFSHLIEPSVQILVNFKNLMECLVWFQTWLFTFLNFWISSSSTQKIQSQFGSEIGSSYTCADCRYCKNQCYTTNKKWSPI